MSDRKRIATMIAAMALTVFAAFSAGFFDLGWTPFLHPFPMLLAVPMLFGLGWFSLVLVPLLYLAWAPQLLRGEPRVPLRTVIAYWSILALSCLYFWSSWRYGVRYQGLSFTRGAGILNLCMAITLGVVLRLVRKKPSFSRSLVAHWLLFAWALSYAFPYLGEGP